VVQNNKQSNSALKGTLAALEQQYEQLRHKKLALDLTRGKPSTEQVALCVVDALRRPATEDDAIKGARHAGKRLHAG